MISCFFSVFILAAPKISVVPDYHGYVNTMFPDEPLDAYGNLGVWGKIKYRLKEYGLAIDGSNLAEFPRSTSGIVQVMNERSGKVEKIVILNVPLYAGIDRFSYFPEGSLHLIVFEPPSVDEFLHSDEYYEYFHKVLTWDDDRVDGAKFVKFFYPVMYPMKKDLIPFEKRKLCTLIARNKSSSFEDEIYSERLRAIAFFEKCAPENFDLYGHGWEHLPFKTYKGSIDDKYEVLKKYRFSICYENTENIKGYITEKIFDCFHCGVVPVYLGASNIDRYIPSECYIDKRDFASYEELNRYMKEMRVDEHEHYLAAIRSYLSTDEARMFSDEHFVETFLKEIVDIDHTN